MARYVNKDDQIRQLIEDIIPCLDMKEKKELIAFLVGFRYRKCGCIPKSILS